MLLDTASLYFRAFHALPDSIKSKDGTPVNAVRGLLDIIARLVADYRPTHLVACWDNDWRPAWRVELIPTYKRHRVASTVPGGVDVEETPPGLVAQLPLIREVLAALGLAVVGADQHEADDVIGSLAAQANVPVDIVTGDRDLFQLVDDERDIRVIYTAKGMSNLEVLTDVSVVRKYGVLPVQYADFATLRGDTSDGLPGVPGIGDKTAAGLLKDHGSLDGIVSAAASPEAQMSARFRAKIAESADYLKVAPTVVNVVRDLDLGSVDGRLRVPDDDRAERLDLLANELNISGPLGRARKALATVGATSG
ncbi:5'-3' exonuclease [Arthrobacter sp. CAU 1506]|uniref:5'-3' exonuclease n=1 Tax=Arthrobacter sp. CAU 1506 TaxID=2560052 RepID=UPI0010ABA55F|nr:5'-3' exonuclease [Arthrobacter sp. CAU 1506]TJY67573.1 5'-3' exonuclease [Arthrobacter sp. CAU 1506]